MKKLLFASLAFAALSTGAFAKSYQAQGCGLGTQFFSDGSSLVHQVLGSTTNGSSGNNTFGMTSGTSGCELDGSGSAQVIFIEANKVALANDIARGNGETLASLNKIYGCSNHKAIGSALQQNYETIFPSAKVTASAVNANIYKIIDSNKACI